MGPAVAFPTRPQRARGTARRQFFAINPNEADFPRNENPRPQCGQIGDWKT